MLNVQALLKSAMHSIVEGWLMLFLTLAVSYGVMWLVRGLLFAFGKEGILTAKRRKYFFTIGSFFVFVFLLFAMHISTLLQDISAASPRKGGFRANFLSLGQVATVKYIDTMTNSMTPMTLAGIGAANVKPGGIDMILVVKIDNSGQPSVAWNWKSFVELPGGSKIEAYIPGLSFPSNTVFQTVVGPIQATAQNNLIQSMSVTPLQTGAGFIGWMMIHVNDITTLPPGSRIFLSFDDVFGRETKIEFLWTEPKH
jgi:hypothetical protein